MTKYLSFVVGFILMGTTVFGQFLLSEYIRPINPAITGLTGICVHQSASMEDCDMIDELCVDWVRMDLDWPLIQPRSSTEWDFSQEDILITRYHSRGLAILGTLAYSPCWVHGQSEGCDPSYTHSPWSTFYDDDWINYVSTVVSRYKDYVDYWQIWNEIDTHYSGWTESALALHVIIPAYLKIKELDPTSKVMGISFSDYTLAEKLFLENVLETYDISSDYFCYQCTDAIGVHQYWACNWGDHGGHIYGNSNWGIESMRFSLDEIFTRRNWDIAYCNDIYEIWNDESGGWESHQDRLSITFSDINQYYISTHGSSDAHRWIAYALHDGMDGYSLSSGTSLNTLGQNIRNRIRDFHGANDASINVTEYDRIVNYRTNPGESIRWGNSIDVFAVIKNTGNTTWHSYDIVDFRVRKGRDVNSSTWVDDTQFSVQGGRIDNTVQPGQRVFKHIRILTGTGLLKLPGTYEIELDVVRNAGPDSGWFRNLNALQDRYNDSQILITVCLNNTKPTIWCYTTNNNGDIKNSFNNNETVYVRYGWNNPCTSDQEKNLSILFNQRYCTPYACLPTIILAQPSFWMGAGQFDEDIFAGSFTVSGTKIYQIEAKFAGIGQSKTIFPVFSDQF